MKTEECRENKTREKIQLGESLLLAGGAFFILGIMIYCRGAFQSDFVQEGALVEGWGAMGIGGLLVLAGSINLAATEPDDSGADHYF